ncbi:YihY/virulence factor BrkB family protein [Flammeovirga aprica]|uniref:YihY/virulence factor BrkB family protein n=1 Tax=Flammeovirga aprica JL-4 TaxID=694437 RepID=A0A7X9RT46_9BACT|nr:YihY/virulence factor BrkB family protein [Flammeovirga aprica]NME68040.1 YihY/virulence factor BrkB family protein [Flammeovirga aprica JL-4]
MKKYINIIRKSFLWRKISEIFDLISEAWEEFNLDHAYIYGASLAYYTIISLPAALNLMFSGLSLFFDENQLKEDMIEELEMIAGDVVARHLESMINSLTALKIDNTISTLISIGTLIFTSTLSFHTLKIALNKFWKVPQSHAKIKELVMDRLIAFCMVLGLGMIFLILIAIDTLISFASSYLKEWLPLAAIQLISIIRFLSTMIMSFTLFSGIFKFIPDVNIKLKDAFVGGLVTTILFQLGQYGIRYYLAHMVTASTWGAGSPIIIVMAWTFYSVQVMFYGAEFTYAYAHKYGHGIRQQKEIKNNV